VEYFPVLTSTYPSTWWEKIRRAIIRSDAERSYSHWKGQVLGFTMGSMYDSQAPREHELRISYSVHVKCVESGKHLLSHVTY
jgi:hypothetical protein